MDRQILLDHLRRTRFSSAGWERVPSDARLIAVFLRAEIEHELERLARLRRDAAGAPRTADPYALRARGSILHDLYSGIERLFGRIAEALDGGLPRGDARRRRLLRSMTLEVRGVRPPVITPELEAQLRDFLSFRHLFRNIYGDELDPDRLGRLEARLPEVHDDFETQIRAFLDCMTEPLQEYGVPLSGRVAPWPISRDHPGRSE